MGIKARKDKIQFQDPFNATMKHISQIVVFRIFEVKLFFGDMEKSDSYFSGEDTKGLHIS